MTFEMLEAGLWVMLALAVAASALFSALETGTYVMNKVRLELHAASGVPAAKRLRKLLANPANLLVVLLVGANLADYAAAFAVTSLLVLAGTRHAEWWTLAAATPVLFILGQSVPKNISQRLGERLMYPLSGFLQGASLVLNAVGLAALGRALAAVATRRRPKGARHSPLGYESFSAIMAEGQASGVLSHIQSVMADRIMHIQEVRLRDVMIPMGRVVGAPEDITRADLLELLRHSEFSRLPVRDRAGQVVGVLDIYDVLTAPDNPTAPPRTKAAQPLFLDQQMLVTDALYQMQRSRKTMAVVTAAHGKHVGIATVKDIVEEIVGELEAW